MSNTTQSSKLVKFTTISGVQFIVLSVEARGHVEHKIGPRRAVDCPGCAFEKKHVKPAITELRVLLGRLAGYLRRTEDQRQ